MKEMLMRKIEAHDFTITDLKLRNVILIEENKNLLIKVDRESDDAMIKLLRRQISTNNKKIEIYFGVVEKLVIKREQLQMEYDNL